MSNNNNLIPRVYQQEAAREALQGNKIIRSDTGTGKTLIAILLIKHFSSIPPTPPSHEPKFIVFISPNVTLVFQQAASIENATSLKVKTFVGADGVDYWKREQWIEQIKECDVGVMTPQVFLNLSDNAYWKFSNISLIVFDECHHASKNNPAAVVMRNHYHPLKARDPSLLPRILGLTASPIYNARRPQKTIDDLEAVLDSRILEITALKSGQVAEFARKAEEQLLEYPKNPQTADVKLLDGDRAILRRLKETGRLDFRAEARAPQCEQLFGRIGLDIYLASLAEECKAPADLRTELEEKASILLESSLSPKVTALVKCLESFRGHSHFHAIVFVHQRHHAKILAQILGLVPSLEWIRAGSLTGHGGKVSKGGEEEIGVTKDVGMAIVEQQEMVKRFRREELNLLVATRVAEEGLDFSACNVVVRFDSLGTITGYIQSRGRARTAQALFVVIAEEGSEEAARYHRYVKQEVELKELYSDRPVDEDLDEPELDDLPTFSTPAGALLTYRNSVPLLSSFCSLLNRTDQFTPVQKPIYQLLDEKPPFRCQLTLPKVQALRQRCFTSDHLPTKKAARQQTAFNCCLKLYRAGALDDHLLPMRETSAVGAKNADGRKVDRTPFPKHSPIASPNPFGNFRISDKVFLHVVEIVNSSGTRRLGLLCATPQAGLDSGELFGYEQSRSTVRIIEMKEQNWNSVEEREGRLKQVEYFNRLCVSVQLNRKLSNESFYALWTLVTPAGEIDYNGIDNAFVRFDESLVTPESIIVLPFRRPRRRLGYFVRVRKDVTSSSPTAEIEANAPKAKRKVIQRYNEYHRYLRLIYQFNELEADSQDPIVEFESIQFSPHFLTPQPNPPQRLAKGIRIFPASMCRISALSLDFWETFAMVPTLNRLIGGRTIAKMAIEQFDLPPIDLDQLSKAFTTPLSAVGLDYEYHETLGDTMLKLATSVHVYTKYPSSEEGRLTTLRMNSVDNRFLRQKSVSTNLCAYLQSFPLRFNSFVPEASDGVEMSSDGLTTTRTIGRKILSDVVESTLGAAVVSGGFQMALEAGVKLDLCFGGPVPWKDRPSAQKMLEIEPVGVAPALQFIEEAIGYKIKTQGVLFVQALTHRSYPGEGQCYEREEYLGDALLDYWCTTRLFPLAISTTPRFLTFRRAMLVSNTVLSLLVIRKLRMHKSILHNSALLENAIREAAEYAEKIDYKECIEGDLTWVWSPPKVLGDVFEALLAVVFVDSGFDLDTVFSVLDKLYEDILPFLDNEKERRDPYSRLLMLKDTLACDHLKLTLVRPAPTSNPSSLPLLYTSTITFHGVQIAEQSLGSKTAARQLAAREVIGVLEGEEGKRCDCKERKMEEKKAKIKKRKEGNEDDEMELDEVEGGGEGSREDSPEATVVKSETKLEDEQDEDDEDEAGAEDEALRRRREMDDGEDQVIPRRRVRDY